jgi:hypothetical protein
MTASKRTAPSETESGGGAEEIKEGKLALGLQN